MKTEPTLPFFNKTLSDLLLELVSIQSVYGQEKDLCDHLHKLVAGLVPRERVSRLGNNLVVKPGRGRVPAGGCQTLPGGHGQPLPVVLLGHIDTVAQAGDTPNPPKIIEDRLYGLGASDMKAGLAVMLAILATMPDQTPAMVFYDKEEGPYATSGLETVLAKHPWLKEAELAVVLEPTANQVQLGCLGTLHAEVVFRGISCHSARPWLGRNPIHQAGELITRVRDWPAPTFRQDGMEFREALSITRAEGSAKTRNVIPDTFTMNLNYRFAPGKTMEDAMGVIEELVYQGEAPSPGDSTSSQTPVEIRFVDLAPAGKIPPPSPLLNKLVNLTGMDPGAKQAWTDVARLDLHGVDAVCLGPGYPEQAHKAGEYTSLINLKENLTILQSFLQTNR